MAVFQTVKEFEIKLATTATTQFIFVSWILFPVSKKTAVQEFPAIYTLNIITTYFWIQAFDFQP